ncbi:MAG: DUF2470 domain-containing protein [Acidimicrobiia bacterium]|nr:DUF2470 domain-containing protein [Acidimicrobiia bacterium]
MPSGRAASALRARSAARDVGAPGRALVDRSTARRYPGAVDEGRGPRPVGASFSAPLHDGLAEHIRLVGRFTYHEPVDPLLPRSGGPRPSGRGGELTVADPQGAAAPERAPGAPGAQGAPVDDPVAATLAELGPAVLDRLNNDFEDSMLLVGRVLGGRPEALSATVTGVDRRGVDVTVTDPAGDHLARIDFVEEVGDVAQLTASLLGLVTRAREVSREEGTTSAEREMAELAGIRTFLAQVVAVADLHPHLRQVTFAGGDLATFAPRGPDTFLYLLLPPPGRDTLTIDQGFTWEQHAQMPEAERPVGGYYTVRRWRPDVGELDVLMVVHGNEGQASAWAQRARPGDTVALWGPRTAYHPPPGCDRLLLVADETGLPAVAAILEQRPPGLPARVLAEVASEAERQALPGAPEVEVTWLHRDGAEAGTTTLLVDAARALPPLGGRPYVWGGGESRAMTAVRRHVRDDRGLGRDAVSLVAYWRHGGGHE